MCRRGINQRCVAKKKSNRVDGSKVDGFRVNGSKDVMELRLYVAGQAPKSLAAISNLKKICTDYLDPPG